MAFGEIINWSVSGNDIVLLSQQQWRKVLEAPLRFSTCIGDRPDPKPVLIQDKNVQIHWKNI